MFKQHLSRETNVFGIKLDVNTNALLKCTNETLHIIHLNAKMTEYF